MDTRIIKPTEENLRICAEAVRGGGIVAFPTETVYGLGASAFDEKAVKKIYRAKGRPSDNPLIVHISSLDQVKELAASVPFKAHVFMKKFMPGAVTMVLKKKPCVPDTVTGGLDTVAIRMPSHPVANKFIAECGVPIAAPSANRSSRPSPTTAKHVLHDLRGRIEYILDGGQCDIGLESTVVDFTTARPRILRSGGVGAEEIEKTIGKLDAVISGGKALCPGMKYKHYSPRAEVLFSAYYANMSDTINDYYDRYAASGRNPVILCLSGRKELYGGRNVIDVGESVDDYAKNLFLSLRLADAKKYDLIIAEGVTSDGLGAGIINRLVKASAEHII